MQDSGYMHAVFRQTDKPYLNVCVYWLLMRPELTTITRAHNWMDRGALTQMIPCMTTAMKEGVEAFSDGLAAAEYERLKEARNKK